MTRQLLLVLAYLTASGVFYAQTIHDYIDAANEASTYFNTGKYREAGQRFEEVFELLEGHYGNWGDFMTYYTAAASWARCDDTAKAFLYLERSVDKGFTDIAMLDSSESFIPLKAYRQWNVILEKIKFKLDKYGSLRNTLEDLYLKDQVLRRTLGCIIDEYGAPSKELSALKMMIAQQDSLNEILVKEIVAEHGWLGVNLIGKDANTGLWAVVQHGSLDLQKRMLPAIKESVHQGYTTGGNYALMYDRIETREGRPQVYGSQMENLDNGEQTLYPILDIENVDKRRAVYGLEPIRDYLGFFNVDYDEYLQSIKN